jgi:hypothetical protein
MDAHPLSSSERVWWREHTRVARPEPSVIHKYSPSMFHIEQSSDLSMIVSYEPHSSSNGVAIELQTWCNCGHKTRYSGCLMLARLLLYELVNRSRNAAIFSTEKNFRRLLHPSGFRASVQGKQRARYSPYPTIISLPTPFRLKWKLQITRSRRRHVFRLPF